MILFCSSIMAHVLCAEGTDYCTSDVCVACVNDHVSCILTCGPHCMLVGDVGQLCTGRIHQF